VSGEEKYPLPSRGGQGVCDGKGKERERPKLEKIAGNYYVFWS